MWQLFTSLRDELGEAERKAQAATSLRVRRQRELSAALQRAIRTRRALAGAFGTGLALGIIGVGPGRRPHAPRAGAGVSHADGPAGQPTSPWRWLLGSLPAVAALLNKPLVRAALMPLLNALLRRVTGTGEPPPQASS